VTPEHGKTLHERANVDRVIRHLAFRCLLDRPLQELGEASAQHLVCEHAGAVQERNKPSPPYLAQKSRNPASSAPHPLVTAFSSVIVSLRSFST